MPDPTVDGTWLDVTTGVRHAARGRLLNISAPSRWATRTACNQTLYVCPDMGEALVVTCIKCLGAKVRHVMLQGGEVRGLKADVVIIDEAKFFEL